MRHRQWIKHWFNYVVWYMMTSSTGVYTNVVLEMFYRLTGRHSKSLQFQRQKPDKGYSFPVAYCRFWSFAHFRQVLNSHWMLESRLLSEYLSFLDKIFTAWLPSFTEEHFQHGKSMFLHTISKRKMQTAVGWREAIVLEIPCAPAWALTRCCLLVQKPEFGT